MDTATANQTRSPGPAWQEEVFDAIVASGIGLVAYVPDAGHKTLINRSVAEPDIRSVVLTTEEEGIGLCAGAWLGGMRSILLMQSSGVGNCVNAFSLQKTTQFPLVMLVTMRGEYAEFNPWQIPMGVMTEDVLRLCDFHVYRVDEAEKVVETTQAAVDLAFGSNVAAAVLLSQRLIGRKKWTR